MKLKLSVSLHSYREHLVPCWDSIRACLQRVGYFNSMRMKIGVPPKLRGKTSSMEKYVVLYLQDRLLDRDRERKRREKAQYLVGFKLKTVIENERWKKKASNGILTCNLHITRRVLNNTLCPLMASFWSLSLIIGAFTSPAKIFK